MASLSEAAAAAGCRARAWRRVLREELTVEHMSWVVIGWITGMALLVLGVVLLPLLILAGGWPALVLFGFAGECLRLPAVFLSHLRLEVDVVIRREQAASMGRVEPGAMAGAPSLGDGQRGQAVDGDDSGEYWL